MTVRKKTSRRAGSELEITVYTLDNSRGLTVSVMNYGAILTSVIFPDRAGRPGEITLGFDEPFEYTGEHPYFGATVGRFANRIAFGRFRLNGKEHHLATNEGRHHLHGGVKGFDKVVWDGEEGERGVRFHYCSPDGEEGYPGTLKVIASYEITEENELVVGYTAETSRPTPVNLTNHAYWNLGGDGSGSILDHRLRMNCRLYLPVDEELTPTGEIAEVSGTPMDFTEETAIGRRIARVAGGYDHCYVVDESDESPAPVLEAVEPTSSRRMEVWSTQPGVQLYTGNFLDGVKGRGGTVYGRHHAFCSETQGFPDAVNQPAFPSPVLSPGEVYSHQSVFRFSTR